MEETHQPSSPQNNPMKSGIITIAIIGLLSLVVIAYEKMGSDKTAVTDALPMNTTTTTVTTAPSPVTAIVEDSTTTSELKDGEYEATGTYTSPAGPEEVKVTVTLKDGIITESEIEPQATNPNSVKFQGQFAGGYKSLVVGKNIDEVKLDVVAGSSLTPKGFQDALEKIMDEAAA